VGGKAMMWSELTTLQLAQVDRSTPVILNIGAIEQHGAHLPVETDALIGKHFTDRLNEEFGDNILVLPQVAVCCSQHHMDFVGTLTVSHETLLQYVYELLESAVKHGFTNIVLFNSHGGNLAIGQVTVEKLGNRYPSVNVFMLTWWKAAADELARLQESAFGGVGHACEFETSLVMHFAPDLVVEEAIADTAPQATYQWSEADLLNAPKGLHHKTMAELTGGTGVFGAPSLGSASKGKTISDTVHKALTKILHDITTKRERAQIKKGLNASEPSSFHDPGLREHTTGKAPPNGQVRGKN
jgi:creatinine amidohydrolase